HDEQAIPSTTRARHIAIIREHVASRAGQRRFPSLGRWVVGSFGSPSMRRNVLGSAAALALAVLLLLVVLQGRQRINRDQIARHSPPQRTLPLPNLKGPQPNEQKIVHDHTSEEGPE